APHACKHFRKSVCGVILGPRVAHSVQACSWIPAATGAATSCCAARRAIAKETQMFHLYTCPTPNGYGVSITLEELGLPYEIHDVDMASLELKQPAFFALNPNGRVPV